MSHAPSRRALLRRAGALLAVSQLGACREGGDDDTASLALGGALDDLSPLTDNASFYVQSYNPAAMPGQDWIDAWRLQISGCDEGDVTLSLDDLLAMEAEEVEHTLECIGNTPRLQAIGNATWEGALLSDVLDALGLSLPDDAAYIQFTCGDGYTTTLPRSDLDAGLRLVWSMNGEALPPRHGAPLRVLVSGRYGMKQPKWVEKITFTDTWEAGYWEARGWSDEAEILLHSWIHAPSQDSLVPLEGADVVGSAFAGAMGVEAVELSDDGGETWQPAEITYRGPKNAWSLWRFRWQPQQTGSASLIVRAIDAVGRVQADNEDSDRDLDGFEGLDQRSFEVV